MAAAAATGGSIAVSSLPSTSNLGHKAKPTCLPLQLVARPSKSVTTFRRNIACFAVQESSAAVAADTKDKKEDENSDGAAAAPAKAKPKPAAKAPPKPLPQMMEEDVIPSLRQILEAEQDITELELSFKDNKLEGSFQQKGKPYVFWAFFPDGVLTGPKAFSLSSYGSEASSVEPFLVDEKKPTAKMLVFWVEKRLAAQGIIPVWKE